MKSSRPVPFGLKQFRNEGCQSYVIHDLATRECAIIDPQLGLMEDYRAYLAGSRLKPRHALDTHIHADHLSATHLFRREFGCEIGMSAETRSERPTLRLKHGQRLELGRLAIEVLLTPGHTPDSCCYLADGRAVFTGDTLLIGGSGRTDFPGADAAAQWKSIHEVLGRLPPPTLVYPGHDYGDVLFSTILAESTGNPHWRLPGQAEFVALKGTEKIMNPEGAVRRAVEFNLARDPGESPAAGPGPITACGTRPADSERVASISVEKLRAKVDKPDAGSLLVDVREPEEFAEGHMPRSVNIPLSELGFHLEALAGTHRCYFSCQGGGRSILATKTLSYLGIQSAVNVTGGFRAWRSSGNPVEKTG